MVYSKSMLSDNSIAKKLLDETFILTTDLESLNTDKINEYFADTNKYYNKIQNISNFINKNYNKEAYLYDIIVISKLYAIIYRLFFYHFNITLNNNIKDFKFFIDNATIKFTSDSTANSRITNNQIILNNLFNIENLNLGSDVNYDTIYNIDATIINFYNNTNNKYIPLYHYNNTTTTKLILLSDFINFDYSKIYKLNIQDISSYDTNIITQESQSLIIKIKDLSFTLPSLNVYYRKLSDIYNDKNDYQKERIFIYLNEFNNILTLDNNIDLYLSQLKYNMYKYNIILYNSLIQYGLYNIKNNIIINDYNDVPLFLYINNNTTLITNFVNYILNYNSANSANYNSANYNIDKIKFEKTINNINEVIINIESEINKYNDLNYFKKNIIDKITLIKTNINIIQNYRINVISYYHYYNNQGPFYLYNNQEGIQISFNMQDINYKIFNNSYIDGNTYLYYNNKSVSITYLYELRKIIEYLHSSENFKKALNIIKNTYLEIKYVFLINYKNNITNEIKNNQYNGFTYNLNDIEFLNTNLINSISFLDLNNKNNQDKNIDKNNDIIYNIKDDLNTKDINNSLISYSDISDKYKKEWKIYNKGVYYYRILLIISIIIFITIVIINNIIINKNIIIYIFLFIIILILFLILFIYKKPNNKEHFESSSQSSYIIIEDIKNNYNKYKSNVNLYLKKIDKFLQIEYTTALNIYKDVLKSNNVNNYKNEYYNKLEYYKTKSANLYNNIEILKLTNMQNYYIILIIYIAFIYILIGLIGLILYPTKFYTIVITIIVFFIITLIILLIKLHKINNMSTDKNYWSNLNPSESLKELN